jgi:hypothetical protein
MRYFVLCFGEHLSPSRLTTMSRPTAIKTMAKVSSAGAIWLKEHGLRQDDRKIRSIQASLSAAPITRSFATRSKGFTSQLFDLEC